MYLTVAYTLFSSLVAHTGYKMATKTDSERKFVGSGNIKITNITDNYHVNTDKKNKDNKFIFVFNLATHDDDDDDSIISKMFSNPPKTIFNKIDVIINFIIGNVKKDEEILIEIDSCGGSVLDFGYVYSQLMRLKEKGYKIKVFSKKVIASGGYLIACVADEIYTVDTAIVGSIGVITSQLNFSNVLDYLKIINQKYTAGEYKSTVDLFDKPTEKNDKHIQEKLNKTHNKFKEIVLKHRKGIDIEKVATGDTWSGDEALKLGLIDKIGLIDDYLIDKITNDKAKIIRLSYGKEKSSSFLSKFFDLFS
mgnify:CR=1 FL=1